MSCDEDYDYKETKYDMYKEKYGEIYIDNKAYAKISSWKPERLFKCIDKKGLEYVIECEVHWIDEKEEEIIPGYSLQNFRIKKQEG